jgi:hypothetical protein
MLAAALILAQRPVDFPADFVGEWRGDMVWDRPGQDKPQTVAMSLAIRPNGTADDHEYRLKYGDQEPRPYVLRPKDRAKGHWQIDEGGGLVLDAFWVGGALVSAFEVGSQTIVTRLWREGEALVSEMVTLQNDALAEAAGVKTRRILGVQRARLAAVAGR